MNSVIRTILGVFCLIIAVICLVLIYHMDKQLGENLTKESELNAKLMEYLKSHMDLLGKTKEVYEGDPALEELFIERMALLEKNLRYAIEAKSDEAHYLKSIAELENKLALSATNLSSLEKRIIDRTDLLEQNMNSVILASKSEVLEIQRAMHENGHDNRNLVTMEQRLLNRTDLLERNLRSDLASLADITMQPNQELDINYQDYQAARQRRTLEDLYREGVLAEERKEAVDAFATGRYVTAYRLYREIATAHPEDMEARFFHYYALFLSNKQERDNYRTIMEAMELLERQGYTRQEIRETMEFISSETKTTGQMP